MRPEPTTIDEMHARREAARARMIAAGEREMTRERAARASAANEPALPAPKAIVVLIDRVASRHLLKRSDIVSRCRKPRIVAARHDAIVAVAQARPNWSLPRLGQVFGQHHTTVLHALRKRGAWPRQGSLASIEGKHHG